MAFAGGRKLLSVSNDTSFRRELLHSDFDIWELNYFPSFRHEIQNPGEHDILSHPDAIQAPMPCVLPETD